MHVILFQEIWHYYCLLPNNVFINNDKGNVIYYYFLSTFILTNLDKPIFKYL